jgi:hypothetical protein
MPSRLANRCKSCLVSGTLTYAREGGDRKSQPPTGFHIRLTLKSSIIGHSVFDAR